jgi:membrane protein
VLARFASISGYDRSLAIATQAFVALIPLLLVVAAAVPARSRAAVEAWLLHGLHLSGDSADAVRQLLRSPPGNTEPITVLGALLLLTSVVGFIRSLQRAHVAAWRLPSLGLRGFGYGLLGSAVLVAEVALLVLTAPLLGVVPHVVLVTALLRTVPSVLLWWPVHWLLLGGRVGWRALLPGAVVSGVGQTLVMAVSGVYVQEQIAEQSARFGLLGVAFVLMFWLIALGVLLVLGAVLSAETARVTESVFRRRGRLERSNQNESTPA